MPQKPNIVMTVADDQQAHAIGALGWIDVQTPHLDQMLHAGTCFTQAHHFGSCHGAVCAPSRAMLHTGRNYFRLPLSWHSPKSLDRPDAEARQRDETALASIPTLGQLLGQHGYRTFATGKWHNGTRTFNQSFQDGDNIFFGGMCDHDKVPVHTYDPTGAYPPEKRKIGSRFSTELFLESALEFIHSYAEETPFFLYVAFTAPHDPRTPPPAYDRLYPRDQIALPPNFAPRHPFDNGHIYDLRDELLAPWPRTEAIIRQHLGAYYGMISHMDWAIGQIHAALREKGLLEDTIVIHTADHGLAVGQHGLLGKQNLYEHSVKVPLVMMGPDVPAGRQIDTLVYQHDLFPTLLEAAQISLPAGLDFQSLWPLIHSRQTHLREHVLCSYMNFQRMVKDPRYKLIRYYRQNDRGVNRIQLFDHVHDPYEMADLSDQPAHAHHVARLLEVLTAGMQAAGDPLAGE